MIGDAGNLSGGAASREVVDNLPVTGLPAGLADMSGPDGRIESPGFTGAHRP